MRKGEWAGLLLTLVLLAAAVMPWLGHLGLEYDEAHFLPLAIQIANGVEQRLNPPWGVTVADRAVPFMTMPYVGTLDSFVFAAPYKLFGVSLVVTRVTALVLGMLVFVLAWLVARREGGWMAGVGVLGMMLADLELVLHIPTQFGPFLMQMVLGLGAVLCFQGWWEKGGAWRFFLGVGLLALGFHEKLTFIWVVSSFGLGMLVFEGARTWRQSRWWYWPVGLLLAVVVVSPILYFAWAVPEVVLGFGKSSAKLPADWSAVLGERWHVFDLMMRGNWSVNFTVGEMPEEIRRGPALLVLFFVGLAAAIWQRQRMALVLYTTAIGVWVWNLAFPEGGRMHHLLLMAPLWQIAAAVAIAKCGNQVGALGVALTLWSGLEAGRIHAWYGERVQQTGGVNHWSDMTMRAAEWFDAHPELELVTTSWGVARPVAVLSRGRLEVTEHYFDTLAEPLSAETVRLLEERISKERQVWLVSSVMPVYEQQWRRVVKIAEAQGRQVYHLKTFRGRGGEPRLEAYTFLPPRGRPMQWWPAQGQTFAVGEGGFRMTLERAARTGADSLEVQWLDAEGKVVMRDTRNFEWFPVIAAGRVFEFTPGYWPKGFQRTVLGKQAPVKARIVGTVRASKVEVAGQ
jgi:hypothetical protein